jgi:ADP-ribose pyrophosphatase YjhB (NUDIX family)
MNKFPKVNVSILVIRDGAVLLGLLSDKWLYKGKQVYGSPGRDIMFRETIGDAVRRNIKDEIDCDVTAYEVICVNANYEWENHYIGIGVTVRIDGTPKLLKPDDWETWEWFDINSLPSNLLPELQYLLRCYKEKKVNVSE